VLVAYWVAGLYGCILLINVVLCLVLLSLSGQLSTGTGSASYSRQVVNALKACSRTIDVR